MKNYIKPLIKVKEMAYDAQICDTSVTIASDDTVIEEETQVYARPHYGTFWDDEEEEK